jgi:PAS domain S-box-containing protein
MSKRFVNPTFFGSWCLVFVIFLIWQFSTPALAQAQPQVDLTGKKVLVLHDLEFNVPILVATNRGLMEVLESGGISIRNQFYENLDFGRNPESEHRKKVAELLLQRYSHRQVDLIVTTYEGALKFALNEGLTIFPRAPIIALYLAPGIEISESNRVIFRHSTAVDPSSSLESALKLLPKTKQVYVVSGAHINDKRLENLVRQEFKKWEGRLEFFYLSDLPMEKILATVSSLPANSIVFLPSLQTDVLGTVFTTREVVQRVSQTSNAPVFGLVDVGLGYGLVGGHLFSYEIMGRKAGELGLEILRSGIQDAAGSPKNIEVRPIPMYDARQLKRWGLNASTLPEGSIVINKELTLWDLRYYIIGALIFCLAETALIIFLIVQRRRKKVAEEGLRQKKEEVDQFFNVSLDLLGIANTEGYFLRLNPAAERILGYTREELMAKRFLEFVHPDDLDRTREAISTLASQQKVFSFENRYRCKDGTYRWLQWSSAPAGKLMYAAARDITERKRTEEILREREEAAREMAREASVLAEIGRTVSSTLNIDQIYEAFAAEAQKIITFDRIVISIFESEKSTFRNVYIAGEEVQDRGTEDVYPVEGSGHAEMLRTKSTVLLQAEDFREYKDRFPMLLSTFEAGFRSIMNVPLFSKGEIIGGLLLRSRKPNAYTDKDVRVAEGIGNQIAGAIAIAQLFQEQKQMENRLREGEERFRQVAENVGDFIWEVDANGLYRYTSPSVEKILGYRPDELVGKKHFYDLFAAEDREELKTAALNVFAAKQAFRDFPNPNTSKEGKVVYLETSGVPMLDKTGNLMGYRGADTDVTERKRSEKALAESQAQILALFNSTNDMIWSVDPETFGLVTFNRGLRDYFFNWQGLEIKAGMTPERLLPPAYAVKWCEFYTHALREGSYVTEYPVAAGTKTLLLSINPLRRDGTVFGISVFGRDITDRKQAEQVLEERLRFERLVSNLSARFVNIPFDQVDPEINRALKEVLEFFQVDRCFLIRTLQDRMAWQVTHVAYAEAQFPPVPVGAVLSRAIHPWAYEMVIDKKQVLAISNTANVGPPEAQVDRQTWIEWGTRSTVLIPILMGESVDYVISINSVKSERGWPEEFIPRLRLLAEILVNVTERKRAEADVARARTELLRVERSLRLNEMTASLAHELNQPLAAILSNAQAALRFLKSDKPDLNEFQEILRDIISDDQRAGNVIRSLRSMMKREEVDKSPIILNNVLDDVIEIFHTESIFRNVAVETELDGSLPPVLGDKVQLQQVVLNLIVNAADAMSHNPPEHRQIILCTGVKDDRIRVTVRDFGPGIDKMNLEHIFEPFFTTKRTGLGIGLAVCHTIVEVHGGRIWAENNPDGGASFFIELPVIRDQ